MKLPVFKPLYFLLKLLGAPVEWEKSVGAVLFCVRDNNREYLLLRYPSGHYEFPRGHVETGETEEDTLRREVEEETGITNLVRIYPLRLENRFFYVARETETKRRKIEGRGNWVFKRAFLYPVLSAGSDVKISHEHREFVWLPYEDALEKLTFANAKEVLQRAEACVRKETGSGL